MRNDFHSADWAENHLAWSSFAAHALTRLRNFLCWWEAHQQWPATDPVRPFERRPLSRCS